MKDHCCSVGDGEFVVAGGECAPLLGQAERTLDDVAVLVFLGVEGWGSAPGRSFTSAGTDFGILLRDNSFNTATGEDTPVDATGVCPVGEYRLGSCAWPPGTGAGHADVVEDLGEHRAVVSLPAGHHHCQWSAMGIDGGVNLGGQTAAGPADAMACRLTVSAQRARFKLDGQIRVIRPCPLCPDRAVSYSLRAGVHG